MACAEADEPGLPLALDEGFPLPRGVAVSSHERVNRSLAALNDRKDWQWDLNKDGEPETGIDRIAFDEKMAEISQILLRTARASSWIVFAYEAWDIAPLAITRVG